MPRWIAVLTALFVTFLWSTSYILNKWAFAEGIQPLTLAGLRYGIAAVTLALVRRPRTYVRPSLKWWWFGGLGLAGYVVAQGFQYVGQYYVTPTQSGMVLSVGNTLLVLAVGLVWLGERPGARQALGLAASFLGVAIYYYPFRLEAGNLVGIAMLLLSGAGYAIQLTANRALLSRRAASPADLTLYPMAVGAAFMIILAVVLEPWPHFTWKLAAILLWLGAVNGALAFFLWTWSQKALQAFESSVLNNTMLLQITALDVLLLGRKIGTKEVAGLVLAGLGILVVQAARRATAAVGNSRISSD